MKVQLSFSAETASFLLENNQGLFKVKFVSADAKTNGITLEFEAINPECLTMGLFLAGQTYTMKQVKKVFNANSLPA